MSYLLEDNPLIGSNDMAGALGATPTMTITDYQNNANVLAASSSSDFVFVGFAANGQSTVTPAASADELAGVYSAAADSTAYVWGGMYRKSESSDPVDSFFHGGPTQFIESIFSKLSSPWVLGAGAVLLGAIVLWSNRGTVKRAVRGRRKRKRTHRRSYARARRRRRRGRR